MESTTTDQEYFDTDLHLSEPRFDEEATVMSARPVVPLNEATPAKRSKKGLGLVLALVLAVLVGALGATFIYKQLSENQKIANAEKEAAMAGSPVSPGKLESGADGAISTPERPAATENVKNVAPPPAPKDDINTKAARSAPSLPAAPVRRTKVDQQADVDDEEDQREMRRAERKEERRLRRIDEREDRHGHGRGDRNVSADDLLRIREIFEGRRRP